MTDTTADFTLNALVDTPAGQGRIVGFDAQEATVSINGKDHVFPKSAIALLIGNFKEGQCVRSLDGSIEGTVSFVGTQNIRVIVNHDTTDWNNVAWFTPDSLEIIEDDYPAWQQRARQLQAEAREREAEEKRQRDEQKRQEEARRKEAQGHQLSRALDFFGIPHPPTITGNSYQEGDIRYSLKGEYDEDNMRVRFGLGVSATNTSSHTVNVNWKRGEPKDPYFVTLIDCIDTVQAQVDRNRQIDDDKLPEYRSNGSRASADHTPQIGRLFDRDLFLNVLCHQVDEIASKLGTQQEYYSPDIYADTALTIQSDRIVKVILNLDEPTVVLLAHENHKGSYQVDRFRPGAWTQHIADLAAEVDDIRAIERDALEAYTALAFEPVGDAYLFDAPVERIKTEPVKPELSAGEQLIALLRDLLREEHDDC